MGRALPLSDQLVNIRGGALAHGNHPVDRPGEEFGLRTTEGLVADGENGMGAPGDSETLITLLRLLLLHVPADSETDAVDVHGSAGRPAGDWDVR